MVAASVFFDVDNLPNAAAQIIPLPWRGARQGGVVVCKHHISTTLPFPGRVVAQKPHIPTILLFPVGIPAIRPPNQNHCYQ